MRMHGTTTIYCGRVIFRRLYFILFYGRRFNNTLKDCHPRQMPRWQVNKEAKCTRKPFVIESPGNVHLRVTRPPDICVNLVFKHIHVADTFPCVICVIVATDWIRSEQEAMCQY